MLLVAAAVAKKPPPPPPLPPIDEIAQTLVVRALSSDEPYEELRELCDGIGHRLSGSPALERAVAWAEARLREDGLANVHTEPVTVAGWERGAESLALVAPRAQPLDVLGLGNTVATPAGGIEAPVLVVSSFDELAAADAKGRIVLFDVPFTTYGETVRYRWAGPSAAARAGAVATLVRSVSPTSLDTPHTGLLGYEDDAGRLPAAAVPLETAAMLHRMQDHGVTPVVRLALGGQMVGDRPSHNVVGEVVGREIPEEVVLLGCHLDSWDVGQGAQDDGAGCAIVTGAVDAIARLGFAPRRTVRVVLFTNEENGGQGGRTYTRDHADDRVVAGLEMDLGAGAPLAISAGDPNAPEVAEAWLDVIRPWAGALAPFGVEGLRAGAGGADVGQVLEPRGLPMVGIVQDDAGYWPIHHTDADTFDKIDRSALLRNVAAVAVVAWALADAPSLPGPARE